MQTTPEQSDTTARDAERKARAVAFLRDKPKAGKGWATKEYKYREEQGNAPLPRST